MKNRRNKEWRIKNRWEIQKGIVGQWLCLYPFIAREKAYNSQFPIPEFSILNSKQFSILKWVSIQLNNINIKYNFKMEFETHRQNIYGLEPVLAQELDPVGCKQRTNRTTHGVVYGWQRKWCIVLIPVTHGNSYSKTNQAPSKRNPADDDV